MREEPTACRNLRFHSREDSHEARLAIPSWTDGLRGRGAFHGLALGRGADDAPARNGELWAPLRAPTRPALIPLPPGAVEPAGWLRDWCLAARDGYTGHLDEYDPEFRRAWAVDHTMTGDRLNWPRGAWPYEGGGYWFDGMVRLGYVLHDDALLQQAKRRLDVVATHMNPHGILFLWWLDKNNPDDAKAITCDGGWPIWACGLLGRAMAASYAGSGDKQILQTLEAGYSGDRNWVRLPGGMSSTWPAFQTYTWTGNKEIAAALTAIFAKDGSVPGGPQGGWVRYRKMPNEKPGAESNDHGVAFLEGTTPWALGTLWTGNRAFLDATIGWHDYLERRRHAALRRARRR